VPRPFGPCQPIIFNDFKNTRWQMVAILKN